MTSLTDYYRENAIRNQDSSARCHKVAERYLSEGFNMVIMYQELSADYAKFAREWLDRVLKNV